MGIQTHIHTCLHVQVHVHTYTRRHVCTRSRVCTHTVVNIKGQAGVMYTTYIHTHIHYLSLIHTYTHVYSTLSLSLSHTHTRKYSHAYTHADIRSHIVSGHIRTCRCDLRHMWNGISRSSPRATFSDMTSFWWRGGGERKWRQGR